MRHRSKWHKTKVPGSLQQFVTARERIFAFGTASLSLWPLLPYRTPSQSNKLNLPEGSGDTVLPGNVGGLEEGGGPGPLRDDDGGGKTGLDHTSSSCKLQVASWVEVRRKCICKNDKVSKHNPHMMIVKDAVSGSSGWRPWVFDTAQRNLCELLSVN